MATVSGTGTRLDYVERGFRGAVRIVIVEAELDARDRELVARAWVDVNGEVITRARIAGDVEAWRFAGDITVTLSRPPTDAEHARVKLLERCAASAAANP